MLKTTSLLVVTLMFLCCFSSAYAQNQKGPSTPEQLKQAVQIATFLETNPLAKEAEHVKTGMASCKK